MRLADGQVIGGSPNLWLDLAAVTLLAIAVVLFLRKGRPQAILLLLLGAIAIGIGSVAVAPRPVAAPNVGLKIVAPSDGAVVPAGQPVDVEVDLTGGKLTTSTSQSAPNVGHLHVSVDGSIVSMPGAPVAPVELKPGPHTIVVEFVTASHQPFAPPITATAHVVAKRNV